MREHNSFRIYFAAVSIFVMIVMTVVLRARAASFQRGSVTIGTDPEITLDVDVANTSQSHEKGLSGRKGLEKNEGMLFLFGTPGIYTFWMKDMLFPIDVIWVREGRVVDLTPDLAVPTPGQQLERYTPLEKVDSVIEVPRGFIKKYGITPGMVITSTITDK